MDLLPDESVVAETSARTLTVTTHRVRYQAEENGQFAVVSIMLEELASCTVEQSHAPLLLALAGLCALGGAVAPILFGRDALGAFVGGLLLGAVFVIAYFSSRRSSLAFASAGATIRVGLVGMNRETLLSIIEATEYAKNRRALLLAGRP